MNGDADIFGVRLQTDINATVGLQMKPKVGSNVIIGFINKSAAYLIMSSEVEEFEIVIGNTSFKMNGTTIEMNGGSFDGLIKIAALTTKLNSLVTEVTAMKNDYLIHTHSVPALGISLVPTVPFVGNFSQFSKSDFEDTTVKH